MLTGWRNVQTGTSWSSARPSAKSWTWAGKSPCSRSSCGPAVWEAAQQHPGVVADTERGWVWASNVPLPHRTSAASWVHWNSTASRSSKVIIPLIQPCSDHVWVPGPVLCFPGQERHGHTALRAAKGHGGDEGIGRSFIWGEAVRAGAVGLREAQGMLGMCTNAWEQTGKRMEPDFSEVFREGARKRQHAHI